MSPATIRDEIIFSSSMLDECIEEVIGSMPSARARQFKEVYEENKSFEVALKKMLCSLVVVMSTAKTFVKDDEFKEMQEILKETDFRKFNGMLMYFAFQAIDEDINSREEEPSYLYGCLPVDVIVTRQKNIKDFIQSISRQ